MGTLRAGAIGSLAPAALLGAVHVVGLVVFAIRSALQGVPRDEETRQRGATPLVGAFLRHYFFWLVQPLWRALLRSGLPAEGLTFLSALLGVGAGFAAAVGRFALAGWLLLFSGMCDVLDGRLARARGEASRAGAAIDSILDRYTDAAILIGLGWYYRASWVLVVVFLALLGSSVVPYVRARGEGLGVELRGGLAQRPERVVYLGISVAFSPLLDVLVLPPRVHAMHWLAVSGIVFVALTANLTALGRFARLLAALRAPAAPRRRSRALEILLNAGAAAAATLADYTVVLALVELGGRSPVTATALGCLVGAGVNFTLNRVVTFTSRAAVVPQAGRYALVSVASLLLNAGGVGLLVGVLPYQAGWWLVRAAVFVLWNYPLHRGYVFGDPPAPASETPPEPRP